MPVRTMCVPPDEQGDTGEEVQERLHQPQGKLKVFRLVKLFIASVRPFLYPSPESLMPPKGVSSRR